MTAEDSANASADPRCAARTSAGSDARDHPRRGAPARSVCRATVGTPAIVARTTPLLRARHGGKSLPSCPRCSPSSCPPIRTPRRRRRRSPHRARSSCPQRASLAAPRAAPEQQGHLGPDLRLGQPRAARLQRRPALLPDPARPRSRLGPRRRAKRVPTARDQANVAVIIAIVGVVLSVIAAGGLDRARRHWASTRGAPRSTAAATAACASTSSAWRAHWLAIAGRESPRRIRSGASP